MRYAALVVGLVVVAGCSSEPAPPDPSELEQIAEVLCDIQRTEGSVFTGERVVVLTDCP